MRVIKHYVIQEKKESEKEEKNKEPKKLSMEDFLDDFKIQK